MVQAEVRRAHQFRQLQGRPRVLPIRLNYEGLLPYSIDAFVENLQWTNWHNEQDNEQIAREILFVIEGGSSRPAETRRAKTGWAFSDDGRPVEHSNALTPPLAEFDPRILDELAVPGGTLLP